MKRYILSFAVLLLFGLLSLSLVNHRTSARETTQLTNVVAIRCGRLIDGKGGVTENAVILISGDKITAAGKPNIPAGAQIVDLSHDTVMPGLIDTHTHITYHYDTERNEKPTITAIYALDNAQKTINAGFTTIRNLGAGDGVDLDLRNAINKGASYGPRIAASGVPLTRVPGDPSDSQEESAKIERIRSFVKQQIAQGADVIKVFVTPGAGGGDRLLFNEEEVRAIVDEASKADLPVAAHCIGTEGIKVAVRAGVTSVEHCSHLDDEAIKLMIEHHTAMVPTLYLPNHYLSHRDKFSLSDASIQGLEQLRSTSPENFAKALKAGVWIVMGSDAVAGLHGGNAKEIESMVKDGMTPAQAIQASTIDAAKLIGWQDRVGSIEPGKFADIIAVHGDPLKDITELQRVIFVMKGGQIIRKQ
ncbi:MAG TPA: amidohydrolase family protein [Blastocatellia bacterium]|nr:amidohydrolase family protein [Blastocatellia bacterium]